MKSNISSENAYKLPNGWRWVKLGDVIEKPRNGFVYEFMDLAKEGIPITRIETISEGFINIRKLGYILDKHYRQARKYVLKIGDILFSHINSFEHVGKTAIYKGNPKFLIHGMNLLLIRAKETLVYPFFLGYLLKKEDIRNFIRNLSGQAVNQVSIKPAELPKLNIPLPPLSEQQKIAEILSQIDKATEKTEKIIEKYERIKRGLMQELLTKGIDEKGKIRNEKTHRFKDFPVGRIPEEWDVKKLGEVLQYEQPQKYIVSSEHFDKNSGTPVLTAGKNFILGYTHEDFGICNHLPVILFDDFTTDSRYVNFPFKVKSSALKILRARDKNINLFYLYNSMQLLNVKPGSEHKRFWISEYSKLEIPLPPSL